MEATVTILTGLTRVIVLDEGVQATERRLLDQAHADIARQKERILEEFVISGAMPRDLSLREWPTEFFWGTYPTDLRLKCVIKQRIEVV